MIFVTDLAVRGIDISFMDVVYTDKVLDNFHLDGHVEEAFLCAIHVYHSRNSHYDIETLP